MKTKAKRRSKETPQDRRHRLRYEEMVKKVPGMLREFYRAAMASGGIAVEDYGDDYEMAKVVLYAACRDMSEQWKPHTPSAQVDARNIILVTYPNYTRV